MTDDLVYDDIHETVRGLFHLKKVPNGLVADLVDFDSAYYTVRVYREQFDKFALPDQLAAMNWIGTTVDNIRSVIPCYLEVWKRPGVPE